SLILRGLAWAIIKVPPRYPGRPRGVRMSETTTSSSANPRVDRLTIVQQLGSGSVGTVAKAKSPKYESFVALRQFQVPEWLDDANELIKRLDRKSTRLNSSHLVISY